MTVLAITFLTAKKKTEHVSWGFVIERAREWLVGKGATIREVEGAVERVGRCFWGWRAPEGDSGLEGCKGVLGLGSGWGVRWGVSSRD